MAAPSASIAPPARLALLDRLAPGTESAAKVADCGAGELAELQRRLGRGFDFVCGACHEIWHRFQQSPQFPGYCRDCSPK